MKKYLTIIVALFCALVPTLGASAQTATPPPAVPTCTPMATSTNVLPTVQIPTFSGWETPTDGTPYPIGTGTPSTPTPTLAITPTSTPSPTPTSGLYATLSCGDTTPCRQVDNNTIDYGTGSTATYDENAFIDSPSAYPISYVLERNASMTAFLITSGDQIGAIQNWGASLRIAYNFDAVWAMDIGTQRNLYKASDAWEENTYVTFVKEGEYAFTYNDWGIRQLSFGDNDAILWRGVIFKPTHFYLSTNPYFTPALDGIATPSPTPTSTPSDCFPYGSVIDTEVVQWSPPSYIDGECYTILPAANFDTPQIVILAAPDGWAVPETLGVPGIEFCTRYLVMSAGFIGYDVILVISTFVSVICAISIAREFRK
jgi:hypothetical protein